MTQWYYSEIKFKSTKILNTIIIVSYYLQISEKQEHSWDSLQANDNEVILAERNCYTSIFFRIIMTRQESIGTKIYANVT